MREFLELSHEVGYEPQKTTFGFDLALWSGAEALKEYARYLLKVEALYRLFFENRIMQTLVNIAPALHELSITGKITSGHRKVGPELDYDVIIVDGYATGHMLALLKAPKGMAEAIKFGPMFEQSRGIRQVLENSDFCKYFIVSLPAELPVVESHELARQIESEIQIKPQIFINKVLGTSLTLKDCEELNSAHPTFFDDIKSKLQRQIQAKKSLELIQTNIKEIPWVLSTKPKEIIKEMSSFLGDL